MTSTLAALPALALLAAPALAQDGAYLELGAGLTVTEEMSALAGDASLDSGFALNALVGYRWEEALGGLDFGLEAEGLYTRQSFDDFLLGAGSSEADYLSTTSFLFNGVLTWPYSEEISFYGGGGVGVATSLDLESQENAPSSFDFTDDTAFVYQGKAGIRFDMGTDLAWFLQFRHVESESLTARDDDLDQEFDYDLKQDAFEIGMRWGQ